jgi:hypothetical protein
MQRFNVLYHLLNEVRLFLGQSQDYELFKNLIFINFYFSIPVYFL